MATDTSSSINFPLAVALVVLPPIVTFNSPLAHPDILAIFITVVGLWLTEAVALPVAGLLVPVLAALYGSLPASKAFEAFGSDILFLFLGCFLMSRSMAKYGFDRRIAYFLLSRCLPGSSFLSLNVMLALTSFLLSMWISNTSAAVIITAITVGILKSLDDQLSEEKIKRRASLRLLLTCAFSASIGGLATPVGSPPNLIAVKFLEQNGIRINFFEWLVVALPLSLCMLILMLTTLAFLFPLKNISFPGIQEQFTKLKKELGPIGTGELQIAVIFLGMVVLWVAPGILQTIFPDNAAIGAFNARFSMAVVGLGGGLMAFFLPLDKGHCSAPNLTWVETSKLEWGTLMLFGGGLTLGALLEQSGAASQFGALLFQDNQLNLYMLTALIVVVSIVMSEFASNTASASILIPLVIGAATSRGFPSETLLILIFATTFAASFGFMLPVSTPPNAIVYGTGKVPANEMRRAGMIFDIIGAVLIVIYLWGVQPTP